MKVYYSTVNAVSVIHVHSLLACELWLDVAKSVHTHPHSCTPVSLHGTVWCKRGTLSAWPAYSRDAVMNPNVLWAFSIL